MSENFINSFLLQEFYPVENYHATEAIKPPKNKHTDKVKKVKSRKTTKKQISRQNLEKRSRNGCQSCKQRKVKCDGKFLLFEKTNLFRYTY